MMSLHKSGASKRKEKQKRSEDEKSGVQTLFQAGIKRLRARERLEIDPNLQVDLERKTDEANVKVEIRADEVI